jgi:hypothetical protein
VPPDEFGPHGRLQPELQLIRRQIQVFGRRDEQRRHPARVGRHSRCQPETRQVAGGPPLPVIPIAQAVKAILDGRRSLNAVEPQLRSLRFKLLHQSPPTVAFCDKHFATGPSKVTSAEIFFINSIVRAIHFHVARFNAFGIPLIDNIFLFDPTDDKYDAWTDRGGDKLSTKQFEIYNFHGKIVKAPGQSIFLTRQFAAQTGFRKHWTVFQEMAHFVGPRDGAGFQIEDHGTYASLPNFTKLAKFQKLHNAEIISLFLLEACIGTQTSCAEEPSVASGALQRFPVRRHGQPRHRDGLREGLWQTSSSRPEAAANAYALLTDHACSSGGNCVGGLLPSLNQLARCWGPAARRGDGEATSHVLGPDSADAGLPQAASPEKPTH